MKKLLFLLTFALGTGAAQAQVKFETKSTDAVREMAIKQGKLVFIDLYASWCPPCRRYGRDAIPLYLVFDTRGELLGRIQGAADAETFMDNLRTIIARQKPHKQQP